MLIDDDLGLALHLFINEMNLKILLGYMSLN